ncbi:MAG: PDZ domain-containing protein [Gemmatimonadales bacterium]
MSHRLTAGALSGLLLAATVASVAPRPLAAQDANVRVFALGRPRIGVSLDLRGSPETNKLGALVREVVPDGPADKAGIKAGDIITKFNGIALGGVASGDEESSGPSERLVELAGKLDAGDTVKVEYRRDNDTRTATIVAKDLSEMSGMRMRELELPRMPGGMGMVGPGMPGPNLRVPGMEGMGDGFRFTFRDRDDDGLSLMELNPELGDYFGTREGILVLRTPTDSTLPLKAGDVIATIDGRKPQSVDHARKILGSYESGESVKVEVMRKQKKMTLTWKVPAERRHEMRWKTPRPMHDGPAVERS